MGSARRITPGNQQLRERDDRLEALKAALGRLAHDFNNLLAPMLGYLNLIQEEAGPESSAAQYAGALEAAARRAETQLETVMLAMRPNRRFSPRPLNLGAFITSQLEAWKADLPPESGLEIIADVGDATVMADEHQWSQAIRHLLGNARYALAMGGQLHVSVRNAQLTGDELAQLGLGQQEACKLVVKDNGFGMSAEVARRAFEPFFTTRTQIKAPGLGLTVLHSVAQVHGGQVTLESAPDQGTTLTVWLPLKRPEVAERRSSHPAPAERRGNPPKALLIEADPVVKEVLRGWLHAEGLEVYTVAGEAEAPRVFERSRGEWALVVIDLKPASSGEKGCELICGGDSGARQILLSGPGSLDPGPWINRPGGPSLLKKPFTHGAFRAAVRGKLAGKSE